MNVRLILQQRQNALVVPAVAIQTGTQGSFVYLVKPGEPPADKNDTITATGKREKIPVGAGDAGAQKGPSYYVEAAPVKVDLTEGSNVILASGVNPGDQIVVDGQEKLKDGARVIPKVIAPRTPSPTMGNNFAPAQAPAGTQIDDRAQGGQRRSGSSSNNGQPGQQP